MDTNAVSKCKKFQANIFNKSKCQNCFRDKEQHTAEALESSKVLRKVSKCGYLFVAPDSFDFTNPMDKTRRWQRRFFVLYDDGELTYSVDENVGTVPQGVIDMNKCSDVHDAETLTSHPLAIAVRTPDKTTFIKGNDKHEIERWFDVLVMYPRSMKTKHRRSPTYPNNTALQPSQPARSLTQPSTTDPAPATRRPLSQPPAAQPPAPPRRHTYTHPPTWTPDAEDDVTEGLTPGDTSLPEVFQGDLVGGATGEQEPLSTSLTRSRSDPKMAESAAAAAAAGGGTPRAVLESVPATYRSVRSMKHRDRAYQEGMRKSNSMHDLSRPPADPPPGAPSGGTGPGGGLYRSRSRDALYGSPVVSDDPFSNPSPHSAPASPNHKPKTFFEALHESLLNPPEPPKPKAKNSRYLRLASIPSSRTIEDYVGAGADHPEEEPSPRRAKSLERPPSARRRPTSPSPVSTTRQPLRSQSSPRSAPHHPNTSPPSSNIQYLRDKFQSLSNSAAASPRVPAPTSSTVGTSPPDSLPRSASGSSCSSSRFADMSGSETDAAKSAAGGGGRASRGRAKEAAASRPLAPRSTSAPSPSRVKGTKEMTRSAGRGHDEYSPRDPRVAPYIVNGRTKNETDEHKMAKSGELAARIGHHLAETAGNPRQDPYDDLMYMKKGWLLKQHNDQDWSKHWFVLSGTSLRFFKDAQAEEANEEDGRIDIASCYDVSETDVTRNYGFRLRTRSQGDHVLSAMTSGIRNNWMQAVLKCMETSGGHRDYSPAHHALGPAHLDFSPASSSNSRASTFSSPSRSSSRHSDYGLSPQRDPAPSRRHTLNASTTPSPSRGLYSGSEGWSRPSRARRSLDVGGGEGSKASPRAGGRGVPTPAARFVSCTWPYDSSSSGASGSEREHTPDSSSHGSRSRRNSNVSQYLEDEEENRSRERTVEEEQALDDVERNIRRIHRRSLSDHSAHHRPPHFDKFESGTAFEGDQASPGRSASSPRDQPKRRTSEERTPGRAPSAKVKEKSRARSPRPRSPPPLEVTGRDMPLDDMTSQQDSGGTSAPSTSGRELGTGREDALVDLLETEVESLKSQLERTRSELTDTKQQNQDLKLQLRSSHRDQNDLISDLETDQSRYLTQIEDIQDQMEHTTDVLQRRLAEQEAKLAEQESHADLTKLQVQTLKKQLKEAKDKMEAQESAMRNLQTKLKSASSSHTLREAMAQKAHFEKMCEDLGQKLKALEEEVERLEAQLNRKSQQLNQKEQRLQGMQEALENSEQHILDLERDLEQARTLRQEAKRREEKMADLEEELSAARSQLSEQDQELAVKDDIHQAEMDRLEQQYTLQKAKLEQGYEDLEKQLEMTRRKSTMSDSLNSNMADILREKDETIAQLEEKLIENDSKIEELTEEIAIEVEENTQLQQNLDASYEETAKGKREVEHLNSELTRLENELEEARVEMGKLKVLEQSKREELDQSRQEQVQFREQVDALQRENSELRHALEDLKQADSDTQQLADLTRECEEHRTQNEAFKEECAKLEREMADANEKVSTYEKELAQLREQHESDLEKRYEELVEARQLTTDLQTQLQDSEEAVAENKKLLDENMAALQPFASESGVTQEAGLKKLEEDREDLRSKYERSMQEVKRLRGELREAHISIDDMEIASAGVKQQVKAMEVEHQQQLAMMTTRVQDLTTKLAASDKKARKLERRVSRRESKLKLRRDSMESGEKTSGSSGEAEHDRETDIRAPDEEVMALLQAVVGSDPPAPGAVDQLQVPQVSTTLNTSISSTNSKLEDSINTTETETSETDLIDQEQTLKLKQLQEKLQTSEAKVHDLSKALELTAPEGQNKALLQAKEQNRKYEQQIIFLTAKLNKSSASASVEAAKAKRAASRDDQESTQVGAGLEDRLGYTQATLEEMQQKLSEVVEELGSASVEPSTSDYTTTIAGLRTRLETILSEISVAEGDPRTTGPAASRSAAGVKVQDPARMFAEKLSLEAALVGEMAHLVRKGQDHTMTDREVYLQEIARANFCVLELEQKVRRLQAGGVNEGGAPGQSERDRLAECSGLLAEKMLLQSQLQQLLEQYKQEQLSKGDGQGEALGGKAQSMGHEALLKGQLSERLLSETGQGGSSFGSHILVQSDVTFILNKLRQRMSDNRPGQDRTDLLAQELDLSHQRLCERANLMCDGVEAYKMAALDKVAATITNNKAGKDEVDGQIGAMIRECAAEYRIDGPQSVGQTAEGQPDARQQAMVEASIQQEVEETVETLAEQCEGAPAGQGVGSEAELTAVLRAVCEVLAQKAVIDGHIAYITEQLQQLQQAPTDQRAPNPLRRHDSGIIVGGSSLPTSPTAEEESPVSSTDGDTAGLAARLAQEATARRQLAHSLRNKDHGTDSVQSQLVKIAADLANVDVDLIRNRRVISDYADVIGQEAMFQAQLTYLTHQLHLQHEHQVRQLQRQIDTKSPPPGAAARSAEEEEQVQALEAEILRLSTLLSENEALLQHEADSAQERMAQMEEELQRQEDYFQTEVSALEQRYHDRVKVMETELQATQEELEKAQLSAQAEARKYLEKIEVLEQELRAAESNLSGRGTAPGRRGLEEKVKRVEEQLEEAHRDLQEAETKHEAQLQTYATKVSELEAHIVSIREKHTSELAQAQEDLKTAVKVVTDQSASRLETEVQRLTTRLEEERAAHRQEMDAALSGLGQDGGALSAKLRQLEQRTEGMQADYEQELAVQRSAHRRELNRSKDELLSLLAAAEAKSMQIDEATIRKRYTKEIEHIKEIYDCGFASMEKSHQRVLKEMRAAHKRELEKVRTEKDQLLIEETKATQAALDAMRKAHEAEVQKERNKFLDAIAKTYSHNDVDAIQRQHEEDLDLIQSEIRQLSEQLSIKCLENAALEERLGVQTRALAESRSRSHELMARNEELNLRLRQDIERLTKMIRDPTAATPGSPFRREGEPPEVYQLRVALKVKDAEMQQLEDSMEALRRQLQGTTEEVEDGMERYQELHAQHQAMRTKYQQQLREMRQRLDQGSDDPGTTSDAVDQELASSDGGTTSERSQGGSPDSAAYEDQADHDGGQDLEGAASSPRLPTPSGGRLLPHVSTEARNVKRNLWRHRHPQRAHSTPGPAALIRRLSLPVDTIEGSRGAERIPSRDGSGDRSSPPPTRNQRKDRPNRHTTVGVNVAAPIFTEKL